MLVKVTAENFKSFEETAELTMVSSAKIRKNNERQPFKICSSVWRQCFRQVKFGGNIALYEILRFKRYSLRSKANVLQK